MNRRLFMKGLVGMVTIPTATMGYKSLIAADNSMQNPDQMHSLEKIELSAAEWKERLTPTQYTVLRKEGTERPFSSHLNDEKRDGIYACAGCDLPLFTSNTKYNSGTGWPSFYDAIPNHIGKSTDFKLIYPRTEYHCIRCGGHQGHVFKDGPEPTGLRYCNNGVALTFTPTQATVTG